MRNVTHPTTHHKHAKPLLNTRKLKQKALRLLRLKNGRQQHLYLDLKNLNGALHPIKNARKTMTKYVVKKPYQSLGVATLFSGLVLGYIFRGAVMNAIKNNFNKW